MYIQSGRNPGLLGAHKTLLPGPRVSQHPATQGSARGQVFPQQPHSSSAASVPASQPRYSHTSCHASIPRSTRFSDEINQASYQSSGAEMQASMVEIGAGAVQNSSFRTCNTSGQFSREPKQPGHRTAPALRTTSTTIFSRDGQPVTASCVDASIEVPKVQGVTGMTPAAQAREPAYVRGSTDTRTPLIAPTHCSHKPMCQATAGFPFRRADAAANSEQSLNQAAKSPDSTKRATFKKGSRVEALWNHDWYLGSVVSCPGEDPKGLGQWRVQCDDDDDGIYTACTHVREPVVDVSVEQVLVKSDDKIWFVVFDRDRNQLGAFGEEHLEFELTATPQTLKRWVSAVPVKLLPGLLALLASETRARKARLDYAEQEIRERYAKEDYAFFGLDENCTDHALEQAYRRISARLHPDKGGDVDAFAAMRQRYDRLRLLRSLGSMESDRQAVVASDENDDQEPISSDANDTGNNAGGAEQLTPEQEYRHLMLNAHDDLHIQLVWVSEQVRKVEKSLVSLMIRQSIRLCLMDGIPIEVRNEQQGPQHNPNEMAMQSELLLIDQPSKANLQSNYPSSSASHAKDHLGTCLICLEQLPADPSKVINLCDSNPRCLCLLHRNCYFNPDIEMSDHLRRCLICKGPADITLVRQAVRLKAAPPEIPAKTSDCVR